MKHPAIARAALLAALGAAALAMPAPASALDLPTDVGSSRFDGASADDQAGHSLAPAGDVNGDGREDVIIGARFAEGNGRAWAGTAYVIYGSSTPFEDRDLGDLPEHEGFRIVGADVGHEAAFAVAGAGDVNGDGHGDVIVGATGAEGHGGAAYIVYGSASPSDVDLANLDPDRGVRIHDSGPISGVGASVAGAGDVNGDGWDDVVVGAPYGYDVPGTAFVLYGSPTLRDVDLAALTTARGIRIDGADPADRAGFAVAGAGDVNGDGLSDVVVGAPSADHLGRSSAGAAYVVYGSATPANLRVDTLKPDQGFRIDGKEHSTAGHAVAGAGDFNGDGHDDVVIGSPLTGPHISLASGEAHVVFGSNAPSDVDLANRTAARAVRIAPAKDLALTGYAVARAGDINEDGHDDVLVGAPYDGRGGVAYVVYGSGEPADVELRNLTAAQGVRLDGGDASEHTGMSVAGAGDVNGDGHADLLVGAPYAGYAGNKAGAAYLVLNPYAPVLAYDGEVLGAAGVPLDPVAPAKLRHTGTATFSVSPPLPAGLTLDSATGVISGTPIRPVIGEHTITVTDASSSTSAPLEVAIASRPDPGDPDLPSDPQEPQDPPATPTPGDPAADPDAGPPRPIGPGEPARPADPDRPPAQPARPDGPAAPDHPPATQAGGSIPPSPSAPRATPDPQPGAHPGLGRRLAKPKPRPVSLVLVGSPSRAAGARIDLRVTAPVAGRARLTVRRRGSTARAGRVVWAGRVQPGRRTIRFRAPKRPGRYTLRLEVGARTSALTAAMSLTVRSRSRR